MMSALNGEIKLEGGGGDLLPQMFFFQNSLYLKFSFGAAIYVIKVIVKFDVKKTIKRRLKYPLTGSKKFIVIIFHSAAAKRIKATYMYIIQSSSNYPAMQFVFYLSFKECIKKAIKKKSDTVYTKMKKMYMVQQFNIVPLMSKVTMPALARDII